MNKNLKKHVPLMVLAITCIAGAGVLTGCKKKTEPTHSHSYTEWNHNDVEHWKECPEDHEIDETTKGSHVYVVGECICGATETVVPAKYGKVTGKVKLHKLGTYETDFTGVNIDLSDDGAELEFDDKTGVFTFSNVKVGENHALTITKSGYKDYTIPTVQVEENQTATIGGEEGIVLEYDVFGYLENYDTEYHDLSKVNEEDPYITFKEHEGNKTLNVLTKESYASVSASFRVNWNNSTHNWHTQGIVLKFEDGNHAIIRYHNGDQENGNIQYANSLWSAKAETSIFAESDLNEWGEKPVHTLLPSETEAIKNGDGLDLTVVVDGGKVYTYFAGNWVATYDIPEETVGKKVQVAYFAYDAKNNAVFNYDISTEVPPTTSIVNINVNKPADAEAATANVVSNKAECIIGEEITLSVTKPLGYKLDTLTVNDIDMTKNVANNTLTLIANRPVMNVDATFVKEEPMAINITMKGSKFGTTTKLDENTVVTFKNTEYSFNVNADGNIINDSVAKGKYTIVVDGYFEKDIVLDENLTEIVLEYDAFKVVRWDTDGHDLSHVNEENPYIEWKGPGASLNVVSKQNMFDDAVVSVILKGDQTTNGGKQQGLIISFEDGKAAILNINVDGTPRLQYRPELFSESSDASIGLHTVFTEEWVEFRNITVEEVNKYNSETGVELKVVRDGGQLIAFIDDRYVGTADLPDQYADDKIGFGFFAYDVVQGSKWYFNVSDKLEGLTSTITNETAKDAKGTIEITESVKLGDVVTITVHPEEGYMLDKLTVSNGVTPVAEGNNVYTFIATEKNYTVSATFVEIPAIEAETTVTGIGLNASALDMNGKEIVFKPSEGAETKLTVADGKVKGSLATGEYTVSCDGFYDLTAVVEDDGSFATDTNLAFEKIIFVYNFINEPEQNLGSKSNVGSSKTAASEGVIKATGDGRIYEWSQEQYKDVAITLTLKSGNGNQGIVMRFNNEQKDVRLRFENTKAQWIGGGWWWGTHHINDRWDFGSGSDYAQPMNDDLLAKYNGEGLTLTLVRKGGMVYAIIDNTLYAAQSVADYATSDARLCVFVEDAKSGYTVPFVIEDADTVLARASVAVGNDLTAYGGTWTEEGSTLKVTGGRGYAEFKNEESTLKESVKINISKANAAGDQGIMYKFADGKYIAVRYQENGGNYKVQYTMDTVFMSDGSLKGWTDFAMTDEEKAKFDSTGIDLTFIRDGASFYIQLGDRLVDKSDIDAKYATMDGAMGIMIWNGSNNAFSYEHKVGENVIIPEQ